jgi:hypothetical protein
MAHSILERFTTCKGYLRKAPTKTKAQQKQQDIQDKGGKPSNNPQVKVQWMLEQTNKEKKY